MCTCELYVSCACGRRGCVWCEQLTSVMFVYVGLYDERTHLIHSIPVPSKTKNPAYCWMPELEAQEWNSLNLVYCWETDLDTHVHTQCSLSLKPCGLLV